MAAAGWYPDPDGTPGRFRYWTGGGWSPQTTFDPGQPPSGAGSDPGSDPGAGRERRRLAPFIVVAAIVVAAALIGWLLIDGRTSQAVREDPDSVPTASASGGWDDSSPLPTAEASAEPSQQPTDVATGRPEGCEQYGDSDGSAGEGGRVRGGPLSYARLDGAWSEPSPSGRVPFSRNGSTQDLVLPEELPWAASAFVGISTLQGFPDGVQATDQLLQCIVTSDFYTSVEVKITENSTSAITISKTPAVQRDTLLRFEHSELTTTGSRLRIIMIDSDPRTFYFHAVPMERDDLIADLDAATASLQLG